MLFEGISVLSFDGHFVHRSDTVCKILVEPMRGNISKTFI